MAKTALPAKQATTGARRPAKEAIQMRVRPETRAMIDQAAKLAGRNRTDFILDAARQAAQQTLLDRSVFPLEKKAYAAFVALLDAPASANVRLVKSLRSRAAWE